MKPMFKNASRAAGWWTLALICLVAASLMFWAARGDSAIDDERAHIPAGYGYVHNLDYRLNPEHPPLVKALAMLPVLFLNPTFPTQSAAWRNEVNAEWTVGTEFLYQSGNDANAIIRTARVFPILLTLLLILFTYLLARGVMGNLWALLPAALVGLSPNFLAHGHYVTTDVGAAFGIVFATYFFLKFVDAPSRKHLWHAGLAFGVAQLTKFSAPFLVPLFIFLAAVLWLRDFIAHRRTTVRRARTFFASALRWAWRLILIFAIGYAVIVYPVYFLFTFHYPVPKQAADTASILASFAGGPTPAGARCHFMRCLADADIWMAGNPLLRPLAEYMLGILMVFQRVAGGNTIYFLGHVANNGGWIYFPLLFLVKEPLPTLAIVLVALALAVSWTVRREPPGGRTRGRRIMDYLYTNFAELSMVSFIVLYWGYSIHSTLNIGIRHLLPTMPFIYILSAGVWKKWVTRVAAPDADGAGGLTLAAIGATVRSFVRSFLKYILLILLVAWLFLETLFAAPYFLSYFNELAGGVWNGYHYVADSNYDWGQDLLRLRSWADAHPEAGTIAVDYFGGGDPHYYLGAREADWSSAKGNPADQGIHWLAVSVNTLEQAVSPPAPGETPENASDTYAWLTALRPPATTTSLLGTLLGDPQMGDLPPPDARAGTSIFLYHL